MRKMNWRKIIMVILVVGVTGALAIQLIPVSRTNPPVIAEPNWDSPETRALAKRACFDCHSNESVWPWYAYVAPVSWLITHDVEEGRQNLNFSEWTPEQNQTNQAVMELQFGGMPLPQYLSMHPEARLTAAEKEALIKGLEATFSNTGKNAPVSQDDDDDDDNNDDNDDD